MKRIILLVIYCFSFSLPLSAQSQQDSLPPPVDTPVKKKPVPRKPVESLKLHKQFDSASIAKDSVQDPTRLPGLFPAPLHDTTISLVFDGNFENHPFYGFYNKPVKVFMVERHPKGNELLFYTVIALLLYFALIQLFFPKYLSNLFSLFFRATLRQQQLREQLLQTPLPSLLLNLLFIISGGMYASFVIRYYNLIPSLNLWQLWLYCSIFLIVVYLMKYLILKAMGWIFRVKAATDTYIFIVFLINKIIGMFLLPAILFLAFPQPGIIPIVVVLSLMMVIGLFIYRYIISYKPVQNEIKVSAFQFFIYLCAFEIAPLLLIYKVLLDFVKRSL